MTLEALYGESEDTSSNLMSAGRIGTAMARSVNSLLLEYERTRLLPIIDLGDSAHTVPLSVLDNWVLKWSLTSAVWYFDPPADGLSITGTISAISHVESLQTTINAYPQWAGQLHWMPYDYNRNQRHGRVGVTYGSASDPGVELILARCSRTLKDLVPDFEERTLKGTWDASSFPSDQLLCPTSLALHNSDEYKGLPCVSVQLSMFACGGVSIAFRIMHPIADATAMFQFVKDWSAVHRAVLANQSLPVLMPIFDPALVDGAAAGDINSDSPDPALLSISRSLPMHRYDCWSSAEGCPPPMLTLTEIPAELRGTDLGPSGEPMPWSEWDMSTPVAHYHLYFAPAEVRRMWEEASCYEQPLSSDGSQISRLDALLAFFWRLLVRARGMEHDPELINIAIIIGLRSRLSPPLPDTFIGSPVTLARVSLTGKQVASHTAQETSAPTLAPVASAIRSAMSQFTPVTVPALLHDMAHVVNPNRFWVAFYGRRHSVVNSWLHLGAYGVDFGGGAPPRYVDAVMPSVDGCIQIMEAGAPAAESAGEGTHWYDGPVCLSLHLAENVMGRLLKDPELRKYGER